MTELDRKPGDIVSGWTIRENGPGIWASDEFDEVSVWIEDGYLHYEGLQDECDIPLAVVDALGKLRAHDSNCTCGLSVREPGAVMGHANSCEVGRFWKDSPNG